MYTQQECLDNAAIAEQIGRQRPEFVIKVRENVFWVFEAKAEHNQLEQAFTEAVEYSNQINRDETIRAFLISGVAGNDIDGYLIKTAKVNRNGTVELIEYNDNYITGLLSQDQARYLVDNDTHRLNELVSDEKILLSIAEKN